ncbi:MAG: TraR/DksA C4-type zinc finger protein [Gammaproteobacteria bacterium]|nr:TraR/DksA C4-type zinc finger protein [Gammaproteobacteria bacterium]
MEEYRDIQQRLLKLREELTTRLDRIKNNITTARSADSAEAAQELENAEVVDALGNETRLELSQITVALDRLEQGSYGTCEDCGITIPMARLEAQPLAARCVNCAAAEEARRD